jgi:hypothetical protein
LLCGEDGIESNAGYCVGLKPFAFIAGPLFNILTILWGCYNTAGTGVTKGNIYFDATKCDYSHSVAANTDDKGKGCLCAHSEPELCVPLFLYLESIYSFGASPCNTPPPPHLLVIPHIGAYA